MDRNVLVIIYIILICLFIILYNLIKSVIPHGRVRNGDDLFISPEDIYEQAKTAIANKNHPIAQKLAKKYLRENPLHDRLRFLLARSYMDTGNSREAIEHLEILIKKFPERLDFCVLLADAYKRIGQSSNAVDIYMTIMKSNPDNIEILLPLAELYNSINHKQSALNIYKRILNLNVDSEIKIQCYIQIITIYKSLKEYHNAICSLEEALNIYSNNVTFLYLAKELYSLTDNEAKELQIMSKLLLLAPNDTSLQLELVRLYYKHEDYENALDVALPALDIAGAEKEELYGLIANVYLKTNRTDECILLLEEVIKVLPNAIPLSELLAYAYRLKGQYQEAIELYTVLIDLADLKYTKLYQANLGSLYCEWAIKLYEANNTRLAFEKFEEALKLDPDNPEIYNGLGKINWFAKNYNDAIRQLQRAIELEPNNCEHYKLLAKIYLETDNIYDAERIYKEAIYVDENDAECQAQFGIIKAKKKDVVTALKYLTNAVKLDPDNEDYIYHLALVYELAGEIKSAIASYNKVLKINSNHVEANKNLQMLNNSI